MNRLSIIALSLAGALVLPAGAQDLPKNAPTKEQLANDNKLFISLAIKTLKWEEAAEPVKIIGPLYFVGTRGLGVFLFTTSEGHILMNTGMPSSGPMIVESIRKLGFKPEDIKIMINGHAHIDHAGAFVLLTAYHTPGHTRGATTWIANIVVDGKAYVVAFPDGAGFNPGYRLAKNPSYPGIADDYRRTHHMLEMLKPDIWLAQHNEYYDVEGKRRRALTEGVNAWIDPEGYRRFVAGKKRAFEDEVDEEMGTPERAKE